MLSLCGLVLDRKLLVKSQFDKNEPTARRKFEISMINIFLQTTMIDRINCHIKRVTSYSFELFVIK